MRNPKWNRDEIILALDLYFKLDNGKIHANNPEIISLSKLLNLLPFNEHKPDVEKFRNANGVSGYFRENGRSFRFQSDAAFRFKLTPDYGAKWPFWLS